MDLYRKYAPALLRKAGRVLGNPNDAEDVVQAVFVDLLSRSETNVDLPYLFRAVTNRCLNLVRDQRNRHRLHERNEGAVAMPARTLCDDHAITIDLLSKLAGQLDERSAEILVYRYFDDLEQEEIATLLSVSRKTVQNRLEKIRMLVRELAAAGEVAP